MKPHRVNIKIESTEVPLLPSKLSSKWKMVDSLDNPVLHLNDELLFEQIVDIEKYKGITSCTDIPVLEFLWGKPFDDYAKSYLLALRPSSIVVNYRKMDGKCDRVHIETDNNNIIRSITQEVEIMCLGDVENGDDLDQKSGLAEYLCDRLWTGGEDDDDGDD